MEILHPHCAGLDVHAAQVTACIRLTPPRGRPRTQTRIFATTPDGLAALRAWLRDHAVTHAALEATGVYWFAVYDTLHAPDLDVTVCNAHHVKNVPGRKTDVADAAWLAQLLASGLLRKSFVPPPAVRALRELTRARVHRVEDRTRVVNGLHRLLARVGLRLDTVVSDLQGVTARAILTQLAAGATDAVALAALAKGKLRARRAELVAVLAVPLDEVARRLLGQALAQLALLDAQVADLDAAIAAGLVPYAAQEARLRTVPGIDTIAAAALLAELGPDLATFADAGALAAWAGVAPGQRESAGRRKPAGTRRGNTYLRRILVQVAMALSRRKAPDALADFFRRKCPALGYKKALVATAHKVLRTLWAMLRTGTDYAPPPPPPLTERQRARQAHRHRARLEALGFDVVVTPRAA